MVTCDLCGGEDFYNDAGHYYCKECQTQSQNIQEHVFETAVPSGHTTRIKATSEKERKDRVTSWECYNYALLGLVKELIDLGANRSLKDTVQVLWLKYLQCIEVIHEDPEDVPRLQAYNSQVDAEIVYGYKKHRAKKRRSRSQGDDLRANKRRMVLANYEQTLNETDISLQNQSLGNLSSTATTGSPKFTVNAEHVLSNLGREYEDEVVFGTSVNLPVAYTRSTDILNRSKLYGILYLALLINKDGIQLGDMLRFIYEGHLSFGNFRHFYPEDFEDKLVNEQQLRMCDSFLSSDNMRVLTGKLANSLDLVGYVPIQNLAALCERYCQELNLPEQLKKIALNIMARSQPQMLFDEVEIPNYEARAISFIIFSLKMCFGLDDVREFEANSGTFEFKKWLHHILYRDLVIRQHHFPSHFYKTNRTECSDTYPKFMKEFFEGLDVENKYSLDHELLNGLLKKTEPELYIQDEFRFYPSLTPYRDYAGIIANSTSGKKYSELLDYNFREDLFEFHLDCRRRQVSFVPLYQPSPEIRPVKEELVEYNFTSETKVDDAILEGFRTYVRRLDKNLESLYPYYFPSCQVWLSNSTRVYRMAQEDYRNYFRSLPSSFRIIVKECARIIKQSTKSLLNEYNIFEGCLCKILEGHKANDKKYFNETSLHLYRLYNSRW